MINARTIQSHAQHGQSAFKPQARIRSKDFGGPVLIGSTLQTNGAAAAAGGGGSGATLFFVSIEKLISNYKKKNKVLQCKNLEQE